MPTTPRDNGRTLDQFNDQLRASQVWQDFMRRIGQNPARPHLSDQQRKQLQAELQRTGIQFAQGMEIDPAGNVNQDQHLGRNIAIGAGIGGGALLSLFGLPGVFPGLLNSGGAAGAAGASGVLPSSSLPAGSLMGGAPTIASQGVSAGIPLGGITGGAAGAAGVAANAAGNGIGATLGGAARNLLSPGGMAALTPLIAALTMRNNGSMGPGGPMPGFENAERMADITEARMRRTDPLHEAVTQLAFNRLPVSARDGIALPRIPLPER